MNRFSNRLAAVISALYLAGGVAVWISFINTNPDGLANVGLIFYVAPVSFLGVLIAWLTGGKEFPFIPHSLGYWQSHAVFFFPSLLIVAALLYAVVNRRQRRRHAARQTPLP